MKKMRIEDGKLFCYIEAQDVETLVSCKEFVRPEVFEEKSIKTGKTNKEGMYKIRDISMVHYIKSLPYIPNADYFANMEGGEHSSIANKATRDNELLYYILDDVCELGKTISEEEKQLLVGIEHVDQSLVTTLLGLDPQDNAQWQLAYKIAHALKQQSLNFLYPVLNMLHDKQASQTDGKSHQKGLKHSK